MLVENVAHYYCILPVSANYIRSKLKITKWNQKVNTFLSQFAEPFLFLLNFDCVFLKMNNLRKFSSLCLCAPKSIVSESGRLFSRAAGLVTMILAASKLSRDQNDHGALRSENQYSNYFLLIRGNRSRIAGLDLLRFFVDDLSDVSQAIVLILVFADDLRVFAPIKLMKMRPKFKWRSMLSLIGVFWTNLEWMPRNVTLWQGSILFNYV